MMGIPKKATAICPDRLLEEIEGDLLDNFEYNIREKGLRIARLRYSIDCIRFFNPTTFKKAKALGDTHSYPFQNHLAMLNNYFKLAWRNLWQSKSQRLINLMGLSVGLTGCLLIGLFVLDEYQYHPEAGRVFRIISDQTSDGPSVEWASTAPPISTASDGRFGLSLSPDHKNCQRRC